MAKLSVLLQTAANSNLAGCAAENKRSNRDAGASDMLLSPRESI
jgi:hypothetical protein